MTDDKELLFESYRELPADGYCDNHSMDEYPHKYGPVEWDASFARRWHITVHECAPGMFVAVTLMTFVGTTYEPNAGQTYYGASSSDAIAAARSHDVKKADRGYLKAAPWVDLGWRDLYGMDSRRWDETWIL